MLRTKLFAAPSGPSAYLRTWRNPDLPPFIIRPYLDDLPAAFSAPLPGGGSNQRPGLIVLINGFTDRIEAPRTDLSAMRAAQELAIDDHRIDRVGNRGSENCDDPDHDQSARCSVSIVLSTRDFEWRAGIKAGGN